MNYSNPSLETSIIIQKELDKCNEKTEKELIKLIVSNLEKDRNEFLIDKILIINIINLVFCN
jgi:hypothetical protein